MAATTESKTQPATTKHKLLKPIYYHGQLIDEKRIAEGIEVDLDERQVEMLKQAGCIG
jgi:hypothetical protein